MALSSCRSPEVARPAAPSVDRRAGVTILPIGFESRVTSGAIPCFQIWRPSRVSHSIVPMRTAEPSRNGNSLSTVPVPKVVLPMIWPRLASWIAPATISAALAVPLSTRTAMGMLVATPPSLTETTVVLPVRSRCW